MLWAYSIAPKSTRAIKIQSFAIIMRAVKPKFNYFNYWLYEDKSRVFCQRSSSTWHDPLDKLYEVGWNHILSISMTMTT